MTAIAADFILSTQEDEAEIAWIIETDDGTPYEYEGGTLSLKVGRRRVAGAVDALFDLTTAASELDWRTDTDGNVYIAAIFPAADIGTLESGRYPYDLFETYGTATRRLAYGFIKFDNGVSDT